MTVAENIAFASSCASVQEGCPPTGSNEAARLLGLTPLLENQAWPAFGLVSVSVVAMGRAIVREPSVFLMDEPLSNLDAKLRCRVSQ